MSTHILITIGMPVYNGERYIREAIDSVLAQTYTNFELIISDNASTDQTENICKDYVEKDSRVKYILHEENIGGVNNFNFVTNAAKGKLLTWLAHDDYLFPDYLQRNIDFFNQNPDVQICACDFKIVDSDNKLITYERLEKIRADIDWTDARNRFFESPISNIYLTIYGMFSIENESSKKRLQTKKFWTGRITATEIPFLARQAVYGRVVSIPEVLRAYRRHSSSAYAVEVVNTSRILDFMHRSALAFDQVFVVIACKLPILSKLGILKSMLSFLIMRIKRKSLKTINNAVKRVK